MIAQLDLDALLGADLSDEAIRFVLADALVDAGRDAEADLCRYFVPAEGLRIALLTSPGYPPRVVWLDVREHTDDFSTTDFETLMGIDPYTFIGASWLEGSIITSPGKIVPLGSAEVVGPGLRATLRVLDWRGHFKSNGLYEFVGAA